MARFDNRVGVVLPHDNAMSYYKRIAKYLRLPAEEYVNLTINVEGDYFTVYYHRGRVLNCMRKHFYGGIIRSSGVLSLETASKILANAVMRSEL